MKVTKEIREKILELKAQKVPCKKIVYEVETKFNVTLSQATIWNVCSKHVPTGTEVQGMSACGLDKKSIKRALRTRGNNHVTDTGAPSLDRLYSDVMTEVNLLRENFTDILKQIRLELIKSRVEVKKSINLKDLLDER